MNRWRTYFLIVGMICPLFLCGKEPFRIISYNVENYFHPAHDSLKDDWEFTQEGNRHWSYTRYKQKTENIARVIANIGGWGTPAIIGLCEVENEKCVKALCWQLKNYAYQYIHYESPDKRGIDVTLLYQPELFQVLESRPLRVDLDSNNYTRDILYAKGTIYTQDTLHILLCHLPSQSAGKANSEWKREKAKDVIRHITDSILNSDKNSNIIVMGDMNTQPKNDITGLNNLMLSFEKKHQGTHKYKGIWECLDQFYVSESIKNISSPTIYTANWIMEEDKKYLDVKPKRTYIGYKYQNGYSDHLPIYLDLSL